MSTHRALRHLAVQLSRAGLHVLRFDYSCTGDSAGAGEDASAAEWSQDVTAAVDELKDTSGLRTVSTVGLRLGALLAANALAHRTDLADLVWWDPIVSGRQYVRELLARRDPGAPESSLPRSGIVGIEGFPLSPVLQKELEAMDVTSLPAVPSGRHAVVVSEPLPEYDRAVSTLQSRGVDVRRHLVDLPARWNDTDRLGAMLLPHGLIQAIVAIFQES
jgi:hypothetical protein